MLLRGLIVAFAAAVVIGFALGSGGEDKPALAERSPQVAPVRDLVSGSGAWPQRVTPAELRARSKVRKRLAAGRRAPREAEGPPAPIVDAYAGVGAWVDQYDAPVLGNASRALVEMRDSGVRTVYLETASWRAPASVNMRNEAAVGQFLDIAHSVGIQVVAWYYPGLDDIPTDLRRSRFALAFRTKRGQAFDGFAVDIESTRISSLPARNAALLSYSRSLRRLVGPDYALGAIVPDLRSTTIAPGLWTGFPYRAVARYYDVFLPMAYSTSRGHGGAYVYRYSRTNVEQVRSMTGRPVHLIGGLTGGLSATEAAAVGRGARDGGAVGASFYDFAIGQGGVWRALRVLP
ncbi:MAG: hypothetical protein QOH76_1779 [Thermoleophilaceae bacterium]|jgi:hypothetical protein|nr:hypothetical protein [Thermoleophilaceae bacterium]